MLEDSLGYAVRRAQVHARDLFFEMLRELELSPARQTALSIIAIELDMNQATRAQRLNVSVPIAMKLIDALRAAGQTRHMDLEGDRRRYCVVLTPAGQALLVMPRGRMAEHENRLAAGLTAAERKILMGFLGKLLLGSPR